jgi:hypothetical protein
MRKIEYTCSQAKKDALDYAWVDTCCINKDSSAELSEAINAMYAWYGESRMCYVYLADVRLSADGPVREGEMSGIAHCENRVACADSHDRSDQGHGTVFVGLTNLGETHAIGPSSENLDHNTDEGAKPAKARRSGEAELLSGTSPVEVPWEQQFINSRWFSGGWTLQELVAPTNVEFFDCDWSRLGHLKELIDPVASATGLPYPLLQKI